MSKELYDFYERELRFIRQLAKEFAEQYPAAASRLMLEENRSVDPHVERLIEAFALLAGRVHAKLDDEFPELTEALLSILYPHYLAPIPSMALVQFELDPGRADLPNGFLIDRHSRLHSQPVNDLACRFRTGYPVTLWPVQLTAARVQPPPFPPALNPPARTAAVLRFQIECQGEMRFATMGLDRLRFHLLGENQLIATLYELIFNHTIQVAFRPLDKDARTPPVILSPERCLFPVGFERDEGLLPYPNQSFLGYRLLTEFFTFPSKFLFLDLGGFRQVAAAGMGRKVEVILYLNRTATNVEQGVDANTFRLGCTPIVNLFEQPAEPIALDQSRYEHRIIPDRQHQRGMEVYSVESVVSTDPNTGVTTEYHPFYSFRHGRTRDDAQTFWHTTRRQAMHRNERGMSEKIDRGTEVYLHTVDLKLDPRLPSDATIIVRTTCTNRDLPPALARAGEELYFELEAAAPISRLRCLRAPTASLRPALRRGAHWKLISHLSLNHLSLANGDEGRQALQEILRLYDFSDPEAGQQLASVNRQLIEGILTVQSRRVVGRTGGPTASGFARGLEVTLEFDEQRYVGTGVYLFACVLERFLGLYASINSFTQLVARTRQGEGYFKKWPPRAGEQQLL